MIQLPEILIGKKLKLKKRSVHLNHTKPHKHNQRRGRSFLPHHKHIQRRERSFLPHLPTHKRQKPTKKQCTINQYTILDKLGSGHFGTAYTVYEPKHKTYVNIYNTYNTHHQNTPLKNGTTFVLKRIMCAHSTKKLHEARKEARILAHVPQSSYLLTIFDFFEFKGDYCIVTNYCRGGTLFDRIQNNTIIQDTTMIFRILRDCLIGLSILHNHKPSIVHRDLKPDNIFYDEEMGNFVLGDMGLSRLVKTETLSYTTTVNYIAYQSPEIIRTGKYTTFSDIWCVGCVLLCVLTNNPLYLEEHLYKKQETFGNTVLKCKDYIDTVIHDEGISKEFKKILYLCLLGNVRSTTCTTILAYINQTTELHIVPTQQQQAC